MAKLAGEKNGEVGSVVEEKDETTDGYLKKTG